MGRLQQWARVLEMLKSKFEQEEMKRKFGPLGDGVVAALLLRLCLMPSGPARDVQERKLEDWLESLRKHTKEHIVQVAWGLPSEAAPCPPGVHVEKLLGPEPPQFGPQVSWAALRVPHQDITLQFTEHCADPTPLEVLQVKLPEDKPWTLSRGSPAGFEHGGRRYLCGVDQYRENPRLMLPTIGVTAFAIPDPWGELEYGECYIISGGCLLTGKFAVWRDPVMCAADIQATRLQRFKIDGEATDFSFFFWL
ncbi:PLG [Symbiodinium necroappetens]|uniref:PLG protein n=1 Tax=Symbiodinium necroappetens TaxID=1628268 RepID=A0A813CA18_9DINO|nr:PLG [Symbiodinium necroappetens]